MPSYAFVIESKGAKDALFRDFPDDKAAEDFARQAGKGTLVEVSSNRKTIAIIRNP